MNTANREALVLARRRGYVVASKNRSGNVLAREWWHHCEQWRIPYVRVSSLRTWANLTLDMEPPGARLSQLACEQLGQLVLFEQAQQPQRARLCRMGQHNAGEQRGHESG